MPNAITVRQFFQSLAESKGLGGQIDTNKDGKFSEEELDTAAKKEDTYSEGERGALDSLSASLRVYDFQRRNLDGTEKPTEITGDRIREINDYLSSSNGREIGNALVDFSKAREVLEATSPDSRFWESKNPEELRRIRIESAEISYRTAGALPPKRMNRTFSSNNLDTIPPVIAVLPDRRFISSNQEGRTQSFASEANAFGTPIDTVTKSERNYTEIPGKEVEIVLKAAQDYLNSYIKGNTKAKLQLSLIHYDYGRMQPQITLKVEGISLDIIVPLDYIYFQRALSGSRMNQALMNPETTLIPTPKDLGEFIAKNSFVTQGITPEGLIALTPQMGKISSEFPNIKHISLKGNVGEHGQLSFVFLDKDYKEVFKASALQISEIRKIGLSKAFENSIQELRRSKKPNE